MKNYTEKRLEIREDSYNTMANGITHMKKHGLITEKKMFQLMDALSDKYYTIPGSFINNIKK